MIKMTNQEIVDLFNGLSSVGNLSGAKFAYAVARNVAVLKRIVVPLIKSEKASDEYIAYDKKRADLAESHADKKNGKAITKIENGRSQYVISDLKKFKIEVEALKVENKEIIDTREKEAKEFDVLLKEVAEIDLYMIDKKHLPEAINTNQMTAIMPIVKE